MGSLRLAVPLAAPALLAAACSGEPPDARTLFERAAAAAEATPAVRYRFIASTSWSGGVRELEGTALIRRLDLSGANFMARVELTESSAGGPAPRRLVMVRQRDHVYRLDATKRRAEHGSLYAGSGSLLEHAALMYAFFDPAAVRSEAGSQTVTHLGVAEIEGERCALVRVEYADDPEDSRWCFAESDALPRSMEWLGPDSTSRLEIFDVEPLATLGDEAFAVEIPEEWELVEHRVGPPVGTAVEPFRLPGRYAESVSLHDLRGQVVVLDFWATWCPPCIHSLDHLESLRELYRDRPVRVLAVNTMESGDPKAFLEERGYGFECLFEGEPLHDQIAGGSLPAFAVIDAEGRWAGAGVGYYGEGSQRYMRRLIDQALEALVSR